MTESVIGIGIGIGIGIERVDVGGNDGAFVETAYTTQQVDAVITTEIERGIDSAPCAFLGRCLPCSGG